MRPSLARPKTTLRAWACLIWLIPDSGGREERGGGKWETVEKTWTFNLCFEVQKMKLGLQSSIKDDDPSQVLKFNWVHRLNGHGFPKI